MLLLRTGVRKLQTVVVRGCNACLHELSRIRLKFTWTRLFVSASFYRSARDIQKWEYVPLGPFGAKNFATSVSPWVVTLDALEPYRCATSAGSQADPAPLDYLADPQYSSYDVQLEVGG